MINKITGTRSSSLPPTKRTIAPNIETNLFNQTQEQHNSAPTRPSSGSFSPVTSPRGRTLLPNTETTNNLFTQTHGSGSDRSDNSSKTGSGSATPTTSPSWRGYLTHFFPTRTRLDPPYKEKFEMLDAESKAACNGLSIDDVIAYLDLTPSQQQDYNEHRPVDRKAYLLLTPDERIDCSKWRDVDVRILYLKLTSEEKKRYREYETLLESKLSESENKKNHRRGLNNEALKTYLNKTKEEREKLYQADRKKLNALTFVKADIDVVKTWPDNIKDRAARYCKTEEYVTHLRSYLEVSGNDLTALNDIELLMRTYSLISDDHFQTKADVEAWIEKNSK